MTDSPGGSFLYRSWLIWPPQGDGQVWSAAKAGLIRTGKTEDLVKEQIDEYEDGRRKSTE